MAEEIKELIRKIQEEGVQAAEAKAGEILRQAQQKADAIVARAEEQAARMIEEAEEKIRTMQANSEAGLKQAGRDMLLELKKEINAMLQRIIASSLQAALSQEELGKIITSLIKEYGAPEKARVVITLSPQDKEKLEAHLMQKLKDQLKHGITMQASNELQAGFIISFDAGKSQFDFSDTALVEFMAASLKPKIAQLLDAKG
ncbi:MAG: hypothetical protein PHT59_03320 [Candidatus Omnitrophica bacterium]|nr:hypothetical protein [Candidatus Omnitrophota bacterium]